MITFSMFVEILGGLYNSGNHYFLRFTNRARLDGTCNSIFEQKHRGDFVSDVRSVCLRNNRVSFPIVKKLFLDHA